MRSATALAIDLGSSSGRIIAGTLSDGHIVETEIHRFAHQASMVDGYLCWDLDLIWRETVAGLRLALQQFPDAATVSVDTWGVDWVALDADGNRLTPGRAYRDERTNRTLAQFRERLSDEQAWQLTGIAPATINTANQLFAYLTEEPQLAAATSRVLLLPDYVNFLLTGQTGWSRSHASTSGMCRPGAQEWSDEVLNALGIPRTWLGDITAEHTVVGPCQVAGLEQLQVVRAGAHDTACAVQALRRDGDDAYFLSSGSWSVLGVLRDEPLLTDQARAIGLTNEAQAEPGVRPLFNITGLWILQECQRNWEASGETSDIVELIQLAEQAAPVGYLIDPDEPQFAQPGDMVGRIAAALQAQGWQGELSVGQIVRTVLESLAARYARGIAALEELTGSKATSLNVMGGGSRNQLLCQLTATALGIPVYAGPAEASTLGSLLAQFMISGDLATQDRNQVLATSAQLVRYEP